MEESKIENEAQIDEQNNSEITGEILDKINENSNEIKPEEENQLETIYDYIQTLVDDNLEQYERDQWTPETTLFVQNYIKSETDKIFFWISDSKLNVSNTGIQPEDFSKFGANCQVLFILKHYPSIALTSIGIEKQLAIRIVRIGSDFSNLIDEISNTLIPQIARDTIWPENMKKELLDTTHKFLAYLTEVKSQRQNRINLYVPNENFNILDKNDGGTSQEQKDLVQRLEQVVVNWQKQITEILNMQKHESEGDNAGPLEEIDFWNNCKTNLVNIRSQLEKPTICKIIDILKQANSSHVKNFDLQLKLILQGASQAEDNLRFLKVLEKPCKELMELTQENTISVLQRVFYAIRMLWEKCPYYSNSEKVVSLFRKVSNEIIKRCCQTINIKELFEGNVEKCIKQLDGAIECGLKWKEVYERNVTVMSKNNNKWQFESEQIFAQIEAFVQRCNDLKEICQGLAQFARREEEGLPMFTGYKGPEIVAVLEEIRETFTKYLAKLKETNESKILDIKSTKWHDDYNVFKLGIKNLDNMYTNLLNFAFDNVFTVEQAVEYMIGFQILARRETIIAQVNKKIERVNEIVIREFRNIENLSNQKPSNFYYVGKFAGKCNWYTSLLNRVQYLKSCYDRLVRLDRSVKESVEVECLRVENNLKIAINTSIKEFKENYKDLENTLAKRLDTNILIESDDARNRQSNIKSNHPLVKKLRTKGHIESNFDKVLLGFMQEVIGFQKLGIGNGSNGVGGKTEEILEPQKGKLRVYRESVMGVVRDYNFILDSMTTFERGLFSEHLDTINLSIIRGVKILRWSSQGTLDNFVKECKAKCAFFLKKLNMFKDAKEFLSERVKQFLMEIRFSNFDSRKVHDLGVFLEKQEKATASAKEKLKNLFNFVRGVVVDLYDNFIDKGDKTQEVWFGFVEWIDKLIEDELRRAVKANFQEFLKLITGDEKSRTNPTQIFRVYIVMRSKEGENQLDFEPTINEFQSAIYVMMAKITELLADVKRFSEEMFTIRAEIIAQIKQELAANEQNKKKEGPKKPGREFPELPAELFKKKRELHFKAAVVEESATLVSEIQRNLKLQCQKLLSQLEPWKKNSFLQTGSPVYSEYTKFIIEKNTSVSSLRAAVEYYDSVQSEIQVEKSSDDSICIQVDTSKIKSRLIELNYEEQKILLTKIKDKSVDELKSLNKKFTEAEKNLGVIPIDLKKLKESMDLWDGYYSQKPGIEETLLPLEEKFKLLDDYMMVFRDEETRLRISIRDSYERFSSMLDIIKKRNESLYQNFYGEHLKKLEDFEKEIRDYKDILIREMPVKDEGGLTIEKAFAKIEGFRNYLIEFRGKEKRMEFGFEIFKIKYIAVPELKLIEVEIENLVSIWSLRKEWEETASKLQEIPFNDISSENVSQLCEAMQAKIMLLIKPVLKWEVTNELGCQLDLYLQNMKLVKLLQDPCLRERHWRLVKESVKENFDLKSNSFNFRKILQLNLEKIGETVKEVHETAFLEFKIELALKRVVERWEKEEIQLDIIKNNNQIKIINGDFADKISEYLEEDLMTLGSLKTSAHAGAFLKNIDIWDGELNRVSEIMDLLMAVQRKFIYFNNIFSNLVDEIGQLQGDKNQFNIVKGKLMGFINGFELERNAKKNLLASNFKETLLELLQTLDNIQKHMRKYLERRRNEIPRFYFLSDEDIFEILGKAKEPSSLNRNIKKMFEGIKSLDYAPLNTTKGKTYEYTKAISPDKEALEFLNKIEVRSDLNVVMESLEKEIISKLKSSLFECQISSNNYLTIKSGEKLDKLIYDFPGQVLITTAQIDWTNKCFSNLLGANSEDKPSKDNKQIPQKRIQGKDLWNITKAFYSKYLGDLIGFIRKGVDDLTKRKLIALITIEVHQKDLLEFLSPVGLNSFEWLQQLRFYKQEELNEKINVHIEQSSARLEYGFEYQGNNGRLVITPLTDRCYLTLTTALHFKRGGNSQGPAGTGKTETIKDLGKNLARFVFVFNCSEGIDVRNLRDLFEGLAQTGFWGCFDEFNRIEIEVLSVIAIQINTILEAVALDRKVFEFEDKEIRLDKNCAIFITMNPGYAGRTELPDNLKSLFRTISMIVPDSVQICRITLQSEGFKSTEVIAKKIEGLYTTMKQSLSNQNHYDFGLRAIKSVLILAGNLRRKRTKIGDKKAGAQEVIFEQRVVIEAIVAINEPKLVSEDNQLFRQLLGDFFVDEEDVDEEQDLELMNAINSSMDTLNLDKTAYFVEKIIQLYATKNNRHGNIIIGESMSGKSTLLQVLQNVQNKMKIKTKIFSLNPKVLSVKEIYGYYDSANEESFLGVFSSLMNMFCLEEDSEEEKWIVFDGPIDTKWIESMNSLLDDNKVLTLMDGNRINLKPNVKILFEVEELNQASPATVSRCGMVYLDGKELTWHSCKNRYILEKDSKGFQDSFLNSLEDLFDKWVEPLLNKKRQHPGLNLVPISEVAQIRNLTNLFDSLLVKIDLDSKDKREQTEEMITLKIEKYFVFAVVWSIGANLNSEGRFLFDNSLRDIECVFPFSQTVFDYFISAEKNEFLSWEEKLTVNPTQWKPPASLPSNDYLVETLDTARMRAIMSLLIEEKQQVLCVGGSGTGKTSLIKSVLQSLDDGLYCYSVVNLAAGTSSLRFQETIESKMTRSTKKKFRPLSGKKAIVFVDDLALPKKDEFGYQPTLELLRQVIEYGGWYDRSCIDQFVQIKDTTFIGAMRNGQIISNRLLNKFSVLGLTVPNDSQMKRIFQSLLSYNLADFDPEEIKPEIENTVGFILTIFKTISGEEVMKSTPAKPHYLFSMKDMSRVVQGIGLIDKLSCDSKSIYIKLVAHETYRVYQDKMISETDRQFVKKIVEENLFSSFGVRIDELCGETPLVFVNFLETGKKSYSPVGVNKKEDIIAILKNGLVDYLKNYNKENKLPLDIVLFKDALLSLCKISRILNIPKGNLLLIGEGGTGRHSLTRLATFISGAGLLELGGGQTSQSLRIELKSLFETIVMKSKNQVLLFSDSDTKGEGVLEEINSLLSVGEVPNLYIKKEGRDEFAKIRDKLKEVINKENEELIYDHFVNLIQQHIHIVFCVNKSGDNLRKLTRDYTGLVYGTTQIFFEDWPQAALEEVAVKFTERCPAENKPVLPEYFGFVHGEIVKQSKRMKQELRRYYYVTPKNFVDFGQMFQQLLLSKKNEVDTKIKKYVNGLERLEEAKLNVEELKNSMEVKRIELHKKKKECEEMIFKIEHEKRECERERKMIQEKEEVITKEKRETLQLAQEAESQLAKALPALKEADEKVSNLDNNSIAEIKIIMKTKDKRMELIMFSLMILLKEKPDWATVQKVVVDANFLKRLREIEKEKIGEDRIQRLEKFTQQPEIQGNLEGYSKAVHTLALYIRAIELFVKINLDVDPIRKRVKKLKNELEAKEIEISDLKENLRKALDRLSELNFVYDSLNNEYKDFQKEFGLLEQRHERSEKLVTGLSSSQEAWEKNKKNFMTFNTRIEGDVMLSSAFLSYFGPFPSEYREELLKNSLMQFLKKKKINFTPEYNFVSFLVSEVEVLRWGFKGLPSDQVSVENGVIVKKACNWPLIVDPQNQGNYWMKNLEEEFKLIVVDSNQKLQPFLEKAIMEGLPILVQNIGEELDNAIEPILLKNIRQISPTKTIFYYNDKEILYNKNFRFYLSTRLSNPIYRPEISTRVTLVNFSVKQKGLEEQLLTVLLRILDEKLENQRVECIRTKAQCDSILNDLETQILEMLEDNKERSLVDATDLIEVLQTSKEKEEQIKLTIETNKINLKKNGHLRENYRHIGFVASVIFFTINQLEKIDYVYQFPLEKYIKDFEILLIKLKENKSDFTDSVGEKVKKIDLKLRKKVFKTCSRALFEKDQLLLAFLIATTLAPIDQKTLSSNLKQEEGKKKILLKQIGSSDNQDLEQKSKAKYYEEDFKLEYEFFTKQLKISSRETQEMNPDTSYISQQMWDSVNELNKLPNFQGILGSFLHNTKEWKRYFLSSQPEKEPMPSDWSQKIKGFSLLLLLKSIRPDRVTFACRKFVQQTLGNAFGLTTSFDLEKLYTKYTSSKNSSPILFLLGAGIDPWPYIEKLAKKVGRSVLQVTLGQSPNQLARAKEKILKGSTDGFWVYLGNIHLSPKYLRELEIIIDQMQQNKNLKFQLFFSSKPCSLLPLGLLQNCIKLALEQARGLKSSMIKIVNNLIPEFKQEDQNDDLSEFRNYKKLIFGLSWYHSILNERKRFRSLGWNVSYEFTDSDFVYSEKMIRDFVKNSAGIQPASMQWDSIRFILGQINYGGRVTDYWDQRLLNECTEQFFCSDLLSSKQFPLCEQINSEFKFPPDNDELFLTNKKNLSNLQQFLNNFRNEFLEHIKTFPDIEQPGVFGQHINAEISIRIEDSKILVESLQTLEPNQVSAGDSIALNSNLAMIEEIQSNIPSKLVLTDFIDKLGRNNKENKITTDPMNTFLLQECRKFNILIDVINNELEMVGDCLAGKILITEEIENILQNFNINRIPNEWRNHYITSRPLFSWLGDLKLRVQQVNDWLSKGQLQKYWLGGFVFPSGFLTALLQQTARKTNVSIDTLKFDFIFMNEGGLGTKDGAIISGLYIEGAKWDVSSSRIVDADPMTLHYELPLIHFRPTEKNLKFAPRNNIYNCPCYIHPVREATIEKPSFVFSMGLPFNRENYNESFFIKRGTAVLLSLNN